MRRNLTIPLATLACATLLLAGDFAIGQDSDTSTAAETVTNSQSAVAEETAQDQTPPANTDGGNESGVRTGTRNRDAVVVFGRDAELKANETAEAVVVIGGSARIYGKVRGAVVCIGGNALIDGEVDDAVVAVMGNVKVGEGARIRGEVVSVGGGVEQAAGADVKGHSQEVDFPPGLPNPEWLRQWFKHCVLMLRPLAPQVGWVWGVAGLFLLLYVLIAVLFPHPVRACVDELSRRPATTFLLGLLTKLLTPLIILILAVTGVGLIVVPFVGAALILGVIVGKVALLEWIGFRISQQIGQDKAPPVLALLLGALLVALLYMIPVLGLITFGLTAMWGLGAAVGAAFGGLRKEMPEKAAPPSVTPPVAAMAVAAAAVPPSGPPFAVHSGPEAITGTAGVFTAPPAAGIPLAATPSAQPPIMVPDALAFPKASFWERMGAAFLDLVIVGVLGAIIGGLGWSFIIAIAYFSGLWAWRSTTIGGIVLGLKVVRLDGQPVSFAVALVRALSGFLSLFVFFLGFLSIIWDKDRQSWHDKIAGTIVIRLPRGTPLICI